ncbi:MAG: ABC transporter ATP-binding protein [Chloroflexi bacterium]|nr:ABC transporter ATP-binding protein [Chloroflexota bacterium]
MATVSVSAAKPSGVTYNVRLFFRLLSFLGPYKGPTALACLFLVVSSVFTLAVPQFLGEAVDAILARGSLGALALLALAVIVASLLRGAASFGQSYLSQAVSQRIAYDLRNALYDRYQRLSFSFYDRMQTAQLMSRATADVEAVRMLISFAVLRFLQVGLLLSMVTAILVALDWRLALITFAVLPFIAYRTTVTSRRLRPLWLKVSEGIAAMSTVLQENLSGIKVVKAFAREDLEAERFARRAAEVHDRNLAANQTQASNGAFMALAVNLASAAILWYGGSEVLAGRLTAGELTKFLLYLLSITMQVRMVGWLGNQISQAVASGERIFEVMDAVPEVKEKPDARPLTDVRGNVRFEGVSFAYGSQMSVLHNVSLAAAPGQVIALLGATGSGKTSLVNLLPRFYDVTAGRVTIDGADIREVTLTSLRQAIGIVQQDVFLFSATIRDNIAYGRPEASQEEIVAAARAACIHDFIVGLPEGYDTWVGERGINLSGGQKQRVAIARTLLRNPRILILDDSLSSVDIETEYLIQQALTELIKGRTTFVIAHRLATVKSADQILVLQEGRIVERGRHEELARQGGPYQRIYELQLRQQEHVHVQATGLSDGGQP